MDEIFNKKIEIDTYILVGEIYNFDLIDSLIKDVREGVKTSKICRKTNVKGENTEFNYLVSNPSFHKFLKIIQPSIYKIYKRNFIIKNVWGNIYKENDFTEVHTHDDSGFCGILYCTDGPGPGTYFNQYDLLVKEKKGRFVLFHPDLFHEVKPFDYKSDRITIAWNFSKVDNYGEYTNAFYIKPDKEIVL